MQPSSPRRVIPAAAGIGLRTPHMATLAAEDAQAPLTAPWLEVHSENFLCAGGPRLAMLDAIAARYPLSCHGVGLSLGSAEGVDKDHLARLRALFDRVKPGLISEHLSWSVTGGDYLNDLLPLPYTQEALDVVCRNVANTQEAFGRQILIENPSAYVAFTSSTMREADFLQHVVKRTGCGLLLDINNVYVSAANNGFSAEDYLAEISADAVGEIHLAGHSIVGDVLIDTHSTHICGPVWELYGKTTRRIGARPTLIEWDIEIPELTLLLNEAQAAQELLAAGHAHVA